MTASTNTLRPPVIEGYQYVADIAAGGYSVVYRYRQKSPQRDVAVKVLTGGGPGATTTTRDAEANAMAKLGNHEAIVQVIVAGTTDDGRHYIIMPYYSGKSLAEQVAAGPLDVRRVVRIGIQIGGALDAAHGFGLLHRDIKPANVLIDQFGKPRLTDFGISGWVGPDQRADAGGWSLPWTPPEIIQGADSSRVSDIYALGAMLWQLLVGRSPFERPNDTRAKLQERIVSTDAPGTGRADVPAALELLLARMLSRDPGRRPRTVASVITDLQQIDSGLGGPAIAPALTVTTRPTPRPAPIPVRSEFEVTDPPAVPVSQRGPASVLDPTARPAGRGPRAGTAKAAVFEKTELKDPLPPVEPEPAGEGERTRVGWWAWAVAVIVVIAVVTIAVVVSHGTTPIVTPRASGDASQDALGVDVPPGPATVTASRINAETLRFAWTYAAAEAGDTYLWRTEDGKRQGKATKPTVDLTDPAGDRLCIEIRVIRATGVNASVDWSPVGCGK